MSSDLPQKGEAEGFGSPTRAVGQDDDKNQMKTLLEMVKYIMYRTLLSYFPTLANFPPGQEVDENAANKIIMGHFATSIANISQEMTCKVGENEEEKSSRIIKKLSQYSWKEKAVISFAAFALMFGKLRLVSNPMVRDSQLARSVALLRQQPDAKKEMDDKQWKSWFSSFAKLVKAMLELTKSIIDFPPSVSQQMLSVDSKLPTAARWIINSAVVCSSQTVFILIKHHMNLAPYEWKLDYLDKMLKSEQIELSQPASTQDSRPLPANANAAATAAGGVAPRALPPPPPPPPPPTAATTTTAALTLTRDERSPHPSHGRVPWNILRILCLLDGEVKSQRLEASYSRVSSFPDSHVITQSYTEGKGRQTVEFVKLVSIFENNHADNVDILKALVEETADKPLVDGLTKERVDIDVLRAKIVLLFISDLDIHREELAKFHQMFTESRQKENPECDFEVVWLPVVDRSMSWKEKIHLFETVQGWMPWYSVYYPSMINPAAIKYFVNVWHFNRKPLVIALDSQGRVVNTDTLHMIRIWGIRAFPFTLSREEALWKAETWGIELLMDSIEPQLSKMIAEGKYMCLYGGADTEWIQEFMRKSQDVANTARIPLEMVYVGKSGRNDGVNQEMADDANLLPLVLDTALIRIFWIRLESMFHSKMKISTENDLILEEIKTIFNFDKDDKLWAVVGKKGLSFMAKANGEIMLNSFMEFDQWKEDVVDSGFLPALNRHLRKIEEPQHAKHGELPQIHPETNPRGNTNFLWRALSCLSDPQTK